MLPATDLPPFGYCLCLSWFEFTSNPGYRFCRAEFDGRRMLWSATSGLFSCCLPFYQPKKTGTAAFGSAGREGEGSSRSRCVRARQRRSSDKSSGSKTLSRLCRHPRCDLGHWERHVFHRAHGSAARGQGLQVVYGRGHVQGEHRALLPAAPPFLSRPRTRPGPGGHLAPLLLHWAMACPPLAGAEPGRGPGLGGKDQAGGPRRQRPAQAHPCRRQPVRRGKKGALLCLCVGVGGPGGVARRGASDTRSNHPLLPASPCRPARSGRASPPPSLTWPRSSARSFSPSARITRGTWSRP